MKKDVLLIVAILLLFSVFLSACSSESNDPYVTTIEDVANDGSGISAESSYWTSLYFKKDNMLTASQTIHCDGVSYTGVYEKSIVDKMNSYETDIYYCNDKVEFGVNSKTGKMVYINLMTAKFFDTEPYLPEVDDPAGTVLIVAKAIAKEYVTDIDKYETIIEEPVVRYKEKNGISYRISYHVITFARKYQGYYSSDYISIKITSKGNLASIMMGDIDVFEGSNFSVDTNRVNTSISSKIDDVYQKTHYTLVGSTIKDQKIAMTPDGKICLYSTLDISLEDQSKTPVESAIASITIIGTKTN